MHGLDRAEAPAAAKAKAMLDEINGSWWNVYIGGPRSSGSGWTPDRVREYQTHGITRFLLTYVGRQQGDVHLLTTSQGGHDGDDACQIAARFGFGRGTPICLDLELKTFEASPRGSLDYVCGWATAVRGHGLRPGVYANRKPVQELASRDGRPDWVWVANWVGHGVDPGVDPHRIPDLDDSLWSTSGERAWQYAGAFDNQSCRVGELDVDISIADSSCLAGSAPTHRSHLEEDDMFTFTSAGKPTFFVAGGIRTGLNEQADLVAIRDECKAKGIPLPHFQFDSDTFDRAIRNYPGS